MSPKSPPISPGLYFPSTFSATSKKHTPHRLSIYPFKNQKNLDSAYMNDMIHVFRLFCILMLGLMKDSETILSYDASKIRNVLLAFFILSFSVTAFLTGQYLYIKAGIEEEAREKTMSEASKAAGNINKDLSAIKPLTAHVARSLASGELSRGGIVKRFRAILDNNDMIEAMGAAFVPYLHDEKFLKNSPFYLQRKGNKEEAGKHMRIFNSPISHSSAAGQEGIITGEVFIEYDLADLKRYTDSLDLGRLGYSFVISGSGTFLYHPVKDYVNSGKSIFDIAGEMDTREFGKMAEKALRGDKGLIPFRNEITGQSSWIAFSPIPATGWALGTVLIRDELLGNMQDLRQRLFPICFLAVFTMILFFCLLFGIYKGGKGRMWAVSISSCLAILAGISFIWSLALTAPQTGNQRETIVVDEEGIDRIINSDRVATYWNPDKVLNIPTGIEVFTLDFTGGVNIKATGRVWQRYNAKIKKIVKEGVLFPDATSLKLREVYRSEEEGEKVVEWYFETTLRQRFKYRLYPFDSKSISIRIQAVERRLPVMCVPDLEYYSIISPESLPGIREGLVLPGWSKKSSFFSYDLSGGHSREGVAGRDPAGRMPELNFSLVTQRMFLDPFISSLFPIMFLYTILFALLLIITGIPDQSTLVDFKLMGLIGSFSGLFFGALLAHLKLRGAYGTPEITYAEFFYFFIYLCIPLVAVNAFMSKMKSGYIIVSYRDNLIPRLIYWPCIMGVQFLLTLWTFYSPD